MGCNKRRDHPRRCGENAITQALAGADAGSPPQVRGKPSAPYLTFLSPRITPAGAGKTACASSMPASPWDHPRRCGENAPVRTLITDHLGSPPQVRGKLIFALWGDTEDRITPAGAGKTVFAVIIQSLDEDHPRRCGENHGACQHQAISAGSPPQVRGKPVIYQAAQAPPRITPAGAGKTMKSRLKQE